MLKKPITMILLTFVAIALALYQLCKPGCPLSHTELAHLVSEIHNMNQVKVTVHEEEGVSDSHVKILWTSVKGTQTIFNGNFIMKPGYVYGANTFSVYYEDRLLEEFTHTKLNNWYSHRYNFILNKSGDSYSVDWVVTGPNAGFNP